MGWCLGGSAIEEGLQKLEEELQNYYGTLNEIAEGLNVTVPDKPEALLLWEKCKALGMPLFEGGIVNQPYIWLQELAVVIRMKELYETVLRKPSEDTAPK